MRRLVIIATALITSAVLSGGIAQAQHHHGDHDRFHDELDHRAFHRELVHRNAHRYPMTWSQHDRLHDALDHEAFHDRLDHRAYHRSYYYGFGNPYSRIVPGYTYGYGGFQRSSCGGIGINTPGFSFWLGR